MNISDCSNTIDHLKTLSLLPKKEEVYIFVYTLIDPINDKVRYVGVTHDPKKRYNGHTNLSSLQKRKYYAANWLSSLALKGLKPKMRILEKIPKTKLVWDLREKFWIDFFKRIGCDLTNTIEGGYCAPTYGRLGKRCSDEFKQRCRDRVKSKTIAPYWSEAHRENWQKSSLKKRRRVNQIDKITGEVVKVHTGAIDAAKELGVKQTAIYNCLSGLIQSAFGFKWEYAK